MRFRHTVLLDGMLLVLGLLVKDDWIVRRGPALPVILGVEQRPELFPGSEYSDQCAFDGSADNTAVEVAAHWLRPMPSGAPPGIGTSYNSKLINTYTHRASIRRAVFCPSLLSFLLSNSIVETEMSVQLFHVERSSKDASFAAQSGSYSAPFHRLIQARPDFYGDRGWLIKQASHH